MFNSSLTPAMPISISEKTRKIICRELDESALINLIDADYQDITPEADVDRAKASIYADRNRGSVRLNAGRYYTAQEYADRVKKVSAMHLP